MAAWGIPGERIKMAGKTILRESEAYSLGQMDANLHNPEKTSREFNRLFNGSYSYYVKGFEATVQARWEREEAQRNS